MGSFFLLKGYNYKVDFCTTRCDQKAKFSSLAPRRRGMVVLFPILMSKKFKTMHNLLSAIFNNV